MRSEFGGHEGGNRLPRATLVSPPSPKLTPQTCSWLLRSRPSSWGRRVRPGPGAAASGVQSRGAPGRPRSSGTRRRQRSGGQGPTEGEERPLDCCWASSTYHGAGRGDDCSSLALLSPQPQLQPKTKTLSTCQQRRSSLGRVARPRSCVGRGRGRSARRRGTSPPPLPGAADDSQPGSSRSAAAAGTRSRLPGGQAHRELERQGSAYLSVCICVWEGLWGGCQCARARGPGRAKEENCTQHRSPLFSSPPRAWSTPQPPST